jgi:hypothetical protein
MGWTCGVGRHEIYIQNYDEKPLGEEATWKTKKRIILSRVK